MIVIIAESYSNCIYDCLINSTNILQSVTRMCMCVADTGLHVIILRDNYSYSLLSVKRIRVEMPNGIYSRDFMPPLT